MKRLIVLFLMLVYGTASIGATVYLHYCCGKLHKVSFSATHKQDCPQKGSSFKNCCDSNKVDLKLKVDQESVAKWIVLQKLVDAPIDKAWNLCTRFQAATAQATFTTGPPIFVAKVPLHIQNCLFRI